MANSDYVVRGQGSLTPYGLLEAELSPDALTMTIMNFQEIQGVAVDLVTGMAVLIGDEIIRLNSNTLPVLDISRGCADTIPAVHLAGSGVWFFSETADGDDREYTATTEIAVKVLPASLSDGPVPMSKAPPHDLTFNWRFSRPYPPGLMLCNGLPWHSEIFEFEDLDTEFTFTWKHRDRLLQADQLVGHNEDSIGPEPGSTYTVHVYDKDNALVRTVTGITAETWVYDRIDAEADVPSGTGRVEIFTVRDSLQSWQKYVTRIRPGGGGGFGDSFGEFGG